VVDYGKLHASNSRRLSPPVQDRQEHDTQ